MFLLLLLKLLLPRRRYSCPTMPGATESSSRGDVVVLVNFKWDGQEIETRQRRNNETKSDWEASFRRVVNGWFLCFSGLDRERGMRRE